MSTSEQLAIALRIREVLSDCSTSQWLQQALRWALERDPVDAAADAEMLFTLLELRAQEILNNPPASS